MGLAEPSLYQVRGRVKVECQDPRSLYQMSGGVKVGLAGPSLYQMRRRVKVGCQDPHFAK